jgi:Mg2+ and Co2+ transporter CorA
MRSDREQIAKLQAFLQEQQGTIARLQRERADAAAEVVRLQATLTVSRARAEDCVCQVAGAVSGAASGARSSTQEEQQSLPLEKFSAGDMDPCVGLAKLRGQELSTALSPENPQLAGIAATDTVTEISLLQNRLARIQRVLAAKTWAVNDLLRRQNEAELGMAKTLQIERASFKLQLNSVLVQVAALQRELQDRDAQIQGLLDNFGTRIQPSGTAICDGSLPPEYSAQLADLQTQVWELRSALQSRAARVTELEQQCTLSTTERALYEKLRLAFVKQGAELQGVQQQRQGYARIIGAAVTVLKSEYADVFVPCAEIAGERYPHAHGAEADYYTLAVYVYRARGQPSGTLQGDACPTLGTSGGADAAHYTASSDDTHTLPSGDLLRDASRAHYSRESGLAVPSPVTGAAMVDLTD